MKIRVIVNDISYYTTKRDILERSSSCSVLQNTALVVALEGMGDSRGFATTVRLYDGKNIKNYQVQLDVM
jgi:hypothetical protein